MKAGHLVLTHAAVFAVGISAALISRGIHEDSAGGPSPQSGTLTSRSSRQGPENSTESPTRTGIRSSESLADRARNKSLSKAPVEQLADIVRIADGFDRQRAMMDLVSRLGADEFAAVAEQFRNLNHLAGSGNEYELILSGWAKADPLSALDFVSKFPNSRGGSATILATWAAIDPAAAERWAADHHEGDGGNPYMAAVIRGIAGSDLATATRLASTMPASRERGEAIDAISRALLQQGADAAMAYPDSIADPQLKAGFVASISDRMSTKDPAKAASWLASLTDGALQNQAVRRVAERLANTDTAAAAAWVTRLKPEAQVEAARPIIPVMSSSDIAGTARWVATLAGTPGYDRAVEEFVWSCNSRAPEQSAAWIAGVANPEQQRRLYFRMLGEWSRNDPAAVKQWVSSNNVPADVKRRFAP